MGSGIFDLHDQVDKLDSAATQWAAVGTTLTDAGDDVTSGAKAVMDAGWEGDTRDSFDDHKRRLVADLDAGGDLAGKVASHLTLAAGSVRVAQGHLDAQWATIVNVPVHWGPGGEMTFQPRDEDEQAKVTAALGRAREIRDGLDTSLDEDRAAIRATVEQWRAIADRWQDVAEGADPFELPPDADGVGAITIGNRTIFNTGSGDDNVTITVDPRTGEQVVTINGKVYRVPAGQEVVIRVGEGNDTVTVPKGSRVDVTVLGGKDDDTIDTGDGNDTVLAGSGDDRIKGGDGDDRISGGAGRDYADGQFGDDTLSGGSGDDTLYGLDGDDTLSGGDGWDYLEGGSGDDQLDGGAGDDTLSGGTDDDTIYGGDGDDTTYTGKGEDTVEAGTGSDTTYAETGDVVRGGEHRVTVELRDLPSEIQVEGSPEFQARVRADLELLASSPAGQQMLANLSGNIEDSGILGFNKDTLVIREYNDPSDPDNSTASNDGHGNFVINYNVALDHLRTPGGGVDGPPIAVLYHELAHVYDYANDTSADGDYQGDDQLNHGTPNDERQAAGLPIDHDDDPSTPEVIDPDHPYQYTENGLREEMGAPHRDHY
ncbi:M91 family zinc metallopeptidase [Nocardioides sp. LML1-1-1.1]|uniref:M91 family zinc metallopeptidase n=1 Tax=Nocardioides sp. LML1-1-1.1 TaxID=3135248 RepID=UPI0034176B50